MQLTFEIDQRFLGCEDFIQGDVRVENERHILLAAPLQKELLKTAKNWYLDGTFKIIRRPFEQLAVLHPWFHTEGRLYDASPSSPRPDVETPKEGLRSSVSEDTQSFA